MRSCWPGCRPRRRLAAARPATAGSWNEELESRTACPTHRARLSAPGLRRGALYEPIPDGWTERADLGAVTVPVLGLHGTDDPVSPLAAVRARYATAASVELISIIGGRHDALNDLTHRTVAATVVIFLERLRLGPGLPRIAVSERPEADWADGPALTRPTGPRADAERRCDPDHI